MTRDPIFYRHNNPRTGIANASIPPLPESEVLAFRAVIGISLAGFDIDHMEQFDQSFDLRAGPHRLTEFEKVTRRKCRLTFGEYNPTHPLQTQLIDRLLRDERTCLAERGGDR